MPISVRSTGLTLPACLFLLALAGAPDARSTPADAIEDPAFAHAAPAPASAASATQRAAQLEQQAALLRTEAGELDAQAAALRGQPAGVTDPGAGLVLAARNKRAQADALDREAATLRERVTAEARQAADNGASGPSGPPASPRPVAEHHEYKHARMHAEPAQRPDGEGQAGFTAGVHKPSAAAPAQPPTVAAPQPIQPPAAPPGRAGTAPAVEAPPPAAASPSATFAAESAQIDDLIVGSAGVSAPSGTKVGNTFSVQLRVSPDKLKTLLQALHDDFPQNATVIGKDGVRLSPKMTATLTGFGFDVSPKEGQLQAVSRTDPTTWQWDVRATQSGVQTLTFSLTGMLVIDGQEVPRTFYEYQQPVQVAVSPLTFLEQYWQWIATTLALPAIGAAWAFFRKPGDPANKRAPGTRPAGFGWRMREKRR